MRRRLVLALGVSALAPLTVFAQQQGKIWRIGFLSPRSRSNSPTSEVAQFLRKMRELDYVEGKNLLRKL